MEVLHQFHLCSICYSNLLFMPNTGAAGEMLGSRTALGSPFHLFALLFPKAASLLLMISCSLGSVGPLPLTFVNVSDSWTFRLCSVPTSLSNHDHFAQSQWQELPTFSPEGSLIRLNLHKFFFFWIVLVMLNYMSLQRRQESLKLWHGEEASDVKPFP